MQKYEFLLTKMRDKDVRRFADILAHLPERNRDIVLATLKGETQTSIALRLDMKQGNVSRTLKATMVEIGRRLRGE